MGCIFNFYVKFYDRGFVILEVGMDLDDCYVLYVEVFILIDNGYIWIYWDIMCEIILDFII